MDKPPTGLVISLENITAEMNFEKTQMLLNAVILFLLLLQQLQIQKLSKK